MLIVHNFAEHKSYWDMLSCLFTYATVIALFDHHSQMFPSCLSSSWSIITCTIIHSSPGQNLFGAISCVLSPYSFKAAITPPSEDLQIWNLYSTFDVALKTTCSYQIPNLFLSDLVFELPKYCYSTFKFSTTVLNKNAKKIYKLFTLEY